MCERCAPVSLTEQVAGIRRRILDFYFGGAAAREWAAGVKVSRCLDFAAPLLVDGLVNGLV